MMEQMDVVNTVAQLKRVPLFTFQSTPTTFSTIKVKSKCFFLFHFKSTGFIDQQADVGQETKKGVSGQGHIGSGYCHVHHVLLLKPSSWLFCYKNCGGPSCGGTVFCSTDAWRASWWLDKAHRMCEKCLWMLCRKGKYMHVFECVCMSWMKGFTSVPLSLWGQVPPTLVRACPCRRLHLQTAKKKPIRHPCAQQSRISKAVRIRKIPIYTIWTYANEMNNIFRPCSYYAIFFNVLSINRYPWTHRQRPCQALRFPPSRSGY